MKRDKLRYKLSIKEKERSGLNANSFSDSVNDALSTTDMDLFWKTWRSKFSNKRLSSVTDGCCNEVNIANKFAEAFKAVSVPNSKDTNEQLHSFFDERFMHYKGNNTSDDFINVGMVQKCIEDLKKGKAPGLDGPMAEHLLLAHPVYLCT